MLRKNRNTLRVVSKNFQDDFDNVILKRQTTEYLPRHPVTTSRKNFGASSMDDLYFTDPPSKNLFWLVQKCIKNFGQRQYAVSADMSEMFLQLGVLQLRIINNHNHCDSSGERKPQTI